MVAARHKNSAKVGAMVAFVGFHRIVLDCQKEIVAFCQSKVIGGIAVVNFWILITLLPHHSRLFEQRMLHQ